MSIPPVVERELRVASRKASTYWSRVGAGAAGMVLVCFFLLQIASRLPLAMIGTNMFRTVGFMVAVTVLFAALQLSSEAFAREKREDTLGLLFLTPLRPLDMVFGKFASTSLAAFYRFVAVVPVLAVPMLAGGVTIGSFLLLVLALLNVIFVGATLGLWISARCWDEKRAVSWTSSTIITLIALPPVVALGVATATSQPGAFAIAALSPGFPVWEALITQRGISPEMAGSLVWTQLLCWIFFCLACRALPRCWQKRPENLAPKGDYWQPAKAQIASQDRKNKARPKTAVEKSVRRSFSDEERSVLLDRNPLAWFAMRWKPPASKTWAIAVIAAIGYVPAVVAGLNGAEWGALLAPGYALIVIFCVNMAIKTFAAHQASFAFARDRGEDTMDLLLSTPTTARELMEGHAHALRETLRPVVRRALWIEGTWLAVSICIHIAHHGGDVFLYVLGGAALLGFLIPDSRALMWTSMWYSVTEKNARQAQGKAITRLVILPWMPILLAWILGAQGGPRTGAVTLIVSWAIVSAIADRNYSRKSWTLLYTRTKLWAVRRAAGEFEHYDGWRKLGWALGRWWAGRSAT